MSDTYPSSYLVEKLKLGDVKTTKAIREQLGVEDLTTLGSGLRLSFNEDRALTAIQMLFAFQGLKPHEMAMLTPQAKAQWGCAAVPVMIAEMKVYCRAYAQSATIEDGAALNALKALVSRRFYLAYSEAADAPLRCLHAPVLAVQKYKLKGVRRPTHLRIALTPVLLQGVYPEPTGFKVKPRDLHARILSLTNAESGRPPEQLLRLTAWLLTLSKQRTVSVSDQKLAERLRSQALKHSQVGKFREVLAAYFEVAKKLGLVHSFRPPSEKTGGKWEVRVPGK